MTKECCSPMARGSGDDPYFEAIEQIVPADAILQSELEARLVEIPGGFFDMGARKSLVPEDRDSPLVSATRTASARYSGVGFYAMMFLFCGKIPRQGNGTIP